MKRECLSRQISDVKKRASPEKDRTSRLAVIDFVQSAAAIAAWHGSSS